MKSLIKKEFFWVFLIFLAAFFLRIFYLDINLFFGWEQGRDAFIVKDILSGTKFTLIGPKTDIEGIFHGPIYYYLISIPYFLSRGDPLLPAYFISLLNSLGIFILFYGTEKILEKNIRYFWIIIYAFSFQGIVFSRWLSNPSLVIFFSTLLFVFLNKKLKSLNSLIIISSWGIILNLELAAGILLAPVLVYYFWKNLKQIKIFNLFEIMLFFLIFISPFILFDLRHEHIILKSLENLNAATNRNYGIFKFFLDFYPILNREFSLSTLSIINLAPAIPLVIILFVFIIFKKSEFARISIIWFAVPIILVFAAGVLPMSQTIIHLQIIFYLSLALLFGILWNYNKFLSVTIFTILIILSFGYYAYRVRGNVNFFYRSYQYSFLSDEKMVLDYMYQSSNGNDFYYNYFTFPYWQPQAWEYLFQNYGQRRYGRLPIGNKTEIFYVIIEPDEVSTNYQENWYLSLKKESQLLEQKEFGKLKVEKRVWLDI